MARTLTPRLIAAQVIQRVLDEGAYSHIALDVALRKNSKLSRRNRALATELTYGTLTWLRSIDIVLQKHVHRKFAALDKDVLAILRVATYQFTHLDRIPEHAIISEAAQSARQLGRPNRIVNFINGVLRSMQRTLQKQIAEEQGGKHGGAFQHPNRPKATVAEKPTPSFPNPSRPIPSNRPEKNRPLLKWPTRHPKREALAYIGETYSLPDWFAQRLIGSYTFEDAEAIARALSERPKYTVRVSPWSQAGNKILDTEGQHGHRQGLARKFEAEITPSSPMGLMFPSTSPESTMALSQGAITVQDEAAQLVSFLVDPKNDERVLDACAGLGGKTAHLAELMGNPSTDRLVAIDPNAKKLTMLGATFERLKLTPPTTLQGDLNALSQEPSEPLQTPFDAVLVDAPCSGFGVIRRHPEIRWSRTEKDILSLAKVQAELLDTAAAMVRPGGRLIYSVCTFTPEEGEQQIEAFLARHPEFTLDLKGSSRVAWDALNKTPHGFLLLPHQSEADGFFMSRLLRNAQ